MAAAYCKCFTGFNDTSEMVYHIKIFTCRRSLHKIPINWGVRLNNVTISVAVENGEQDDSTLPEPTSDDRAEFTDQDNRTTTELPSGS